MASIDKRIPNQSIEPSRFVQSPRVEDVVYRLHYCKIFTKLDLRQGYRQLALDPSTRQVVHIQHTLGKLQTPTIGVWSEVISRCLRRSHVQNLWGYTPLLKPKGWQAQNRKVLKTILKRERDHGINREKCQFGKEQIQFFEHVFTKDGLKPSPDKVRAIKQCRECLRTERQCEASLGWQATWKTSYRTMQP